MVCPNCYAYLKDRLTARVITIYEKAGRAWHRQEISGKTEIFPPCPDREKWEILSHIRPFLEEEPELITKIQCCGLGGCAGQKEPDLAGQMLEGHLREERDLHLLCILFREYCKKRIWRSRLSAAGDPEQQGKAGCISCDRQSQKGKRLAGTRKIKRRDDK